MLKISKERQQQYYHSLFLAKAALGLGPASSLIAPEKISTEAMTSVSRWLPSSIFFPALSHTSIGRSTLKEVEKAVVGVH